MEEVLEEALEEQEYMILHLCVVDPVEKPSPSKILRTRSRRRNQNLMLVSFITDTSTLQEMMHITSAG